MCRVKQRKNANLLLATSSGNPFGTVRALSVAYSRTTGITHTGTVCFTVICALFQPSALCRPSLCLVRVCFTPSADLDLQNTARPAILDRFHLVYEGNVTTGPATQNCCFLIMTRNIKGHIQCTGEVRYFVTRYDMTQARLTFFQKQEQNSTQHKQKYTLVSDVHCLENRTLYEEYTWHCGNVNCMEYSYGGFLIPKLKVIWLKPKPCQYYFYKNKLASFYCILVW